jgi:hypothetical protein
MPRLAYRLLLLLSLLAIRPYHAHGESILEQLPADATAFVVVHDLQSASEKIERVTTIFENVTPGRLPAPLALAMGATGIGPGLDVHGDALLVFMPGDDAPLSPQPLLLLPVSDYRALAETIGGDATGEISRVTIADEEVLLAQRGRFAALMNVEHRNQLENFLASSPALPAEVAGLSDWLATTDVAAGVTRSGVERLAALARRRASDARVQAAGAGDSPEMRELQETLQELDDVVQFFGAEMQAGAIGLTIDDATNAKLAKRVILSKTGMLANTTAGAPLEKSPLERFAQGPFVAVGGGPLPPGFGDALARRLRQFVEGLPAQQSYQGLEASDWKKLEESYRQSVDGLKSISFILRPGKGEEGLLSNYLFIAEADDSSAYLGSFRRSCELYNEVMESAQNDLSIPYELHERTIGGDRAVLAQADVASAAADPNVAGVDPLMRTIFGPDGKLSIYAIAADERTVAIGAAAEATLADAVQFALDGGSSLAGDAGVGATAALLDEKAPWVAFVSPEGLVAWIARAAQTLSAAFGGEIKIPPFPPTPPVGLSINLSDGQLQSEIAMPRQTLQGIADYVSRLLAE